MKGSFSMKVRRIDQGHGMHCYKKSNINISTMVSLLLSYEEGQYTLWENIYDSRWPPTRRWFLAK
jgi:hypothetical protein